PEPRLQTEWRSRMSSMGGGGAAREGIMAGHRNVRIVRGPTPSSASPLVRDVAQSPGRPLSGEKSGFFESPFGYDFSRVRVHADARAATSETAPAMTHPGDRDEQEADRMAEAALSGRAPVRPSCGCEPAIRRKRAACEEEQDKIARRAAGGAPAAAQS